MKRYESCNAICEILANTAAKEIYIDGPYAYHGYITNNGKAVIPFGDWIEVYDEGEYKA